MIKTTKRETAPEESIVVRENLSAYLNKYFPIVRAGQLTLEDDFLEYEPETEKQRKMKKLFVQTISEGLHDFRAQAMNASYNEEEDKIYFMPGNDVVTGKSMEWIIEHAKGFLPEKRSRNGNEKEMIAYLAVLIKELVEIEGYPIQKAWWTVCDDSRSLGNCADSKDSCGLEKTGSRPILDWYDLGNIYHAVTAKQENEGELWGSNYLLNGCDAPLSKRKSCPYMDQDLGNATMWVVIPSVDGL